MAITQVAYTGDGSTTQYTIPFTYIDQSEVIVEVNRSATTDFTFSNATTIQLNTAPANGVLVLITRNTDIDTTKIIYYPGSAIRAEDLNDNFDQSRLSVQEWRDQKIPYYNAVFPDRVDMGNNPIINVEDPTNDQDAATKNYVKNYVEDNTWNLTDETLQAGETWVSSDAYIATSQSIDQRIDTKIDTAITNDIGTDGTGITVTDDGDGTITLGIGSNSVDFDRIKTSDVFQTSEYSDTWTDEDDKLATAGSIAKRHDLTISTSAPSNVQLGKLWFNSTVGVSSLNMWDGSNWKVITSGTPYIPQGTTIVRYVDAVNGSDATDVTGFLPQAPLQSIERALTLINASSSGDGTLVVVAPGVYQETLPLRIKKNNVSIVGTSMRSCFVHPTVATENNDMFEVTSGSYIANLTMLGLKVPTGNQGSRNNTLDNDSTYGLPTNQPWAVRFRTDTQPIILKSPYIQNCTHFSDAHFDNVNFNPNSFPSTDAQTYSAVAGDQTSAPCGGGLLIDGSAVSSSSPIRSMVVDAFTQICLDGPGVLVTNNGYAQLVSFFGTFTHYHAKAKNGGQVNLSNCVSDFGRYGLIADGKSPSSIANATITSPTAGNGSGNTTVTIGAITTDSGFHGTVTQPLDHMMITIDGVDYGVVSSTANGAGWDVTLSSGLTSNITSTAANFALRSYISTGGHTFEFVGVGTDYSDHPDNGGVPVEANQVIELNGGKVWQSSTDHVGKFKAGNVLVVDQVSETVDLKDTTVTGNITVTGTVDGRDVATDGTKLDGIESGATADQTAAEIRSLVNSAADSNVFTDADHSKLDGIESGATADQTADEIRSLVNSATDSNVFTDADHTKLDGIATGATAYANSDVDSHLNTSTASANEVLSWTGSDYDWVAQTGGGSYTDSDVDTHLNTSTANANEVLSWTGSDYDWVTSSGASLSTAQTFTAGQRGEITTLTSGATITPNFDDSNNFTVTLGTNATIANPTNLTAGQSGSIFIVQDATGSRTASWGSYWDFASASVPTLTTTGNAVDRIDYVVRSSTSIHAVATFNYS